MQLGSVLSNSSTVSNSPEVKVLNSQRDQAEAVIGKIFEGVAESAQRVQEQSGQRLNIAA